MTAEELQAITHRLDVMLAVSNVVPEQYDRNVQQLIRNDMPRLLIEVRCLTEIAELARELLAGIESGKSFAGSFSLDQALAKWEQAK